MSKVAATQQERMLTIDALEDRLAVAGLSVSKSADESGVARGSVEKMAAGSAVRKLTLFTFVQNLRAKGYDIDPGGEIVPHSDTDTFERASNPDFLGSNVMRTTKFAAQEPISRFAERVLQKARDLENELIALRDRAFDGRDREAFVSEDLEVLGKRFQGIAFQWDQIEDYVRIQRAKLES